LTTGYRLWRRLDEAQARLRTRLASACAPPVSSATSPWGHLLEHFRAVFPGSACPFAAFQRQLQSPLLG